MNDIEKAKKLLKDNGYIILKFTEEMKNDSKECDAMDDDGESKECFFCSCSMCVIGGK